MNLLRGMSRARRRMAVAGLALVGVISVVLGVGWAMQPGPPVPDGPVQTTGALPTSPATTPLAEPGEATERSKGRERGRVPAAATVDDVPRSWQRIAAAAASWPAAAAPPVLGEVAAVPTVPASRMRDTLGLNIDVWRTDGGYRDFAPLLAKATELRLRHARVGMQAHGDHGLARMQQLGQIGVRLDVNMGDALGRYDTTPFATLRERLHDAVLPYVDSVEGTNEPDLAKRADWVARARGHQGSVVEAVKRERGRPIAVIAPSAGRIANVPQFGSYAGLADAANAHAYSSAGEPSAPLDQWAEMLRSQLPGGPVVVTEAGFQTDLGQTKYHTPLPPEIAAAYVPRILLESIRRGMPRVYLYEMADRWEDPFGVDTAAHFGLLEHDLTPKPAWTALVRLQRALLDGGAPDRRAAPLQANITQGPSDLRLLAFRHRDGTTTLALWRAVSQWDIQTLTPTPPSAERVVVELAEPTAEGDEAPLATDVVSGQRRRLPAGQTIDLDVTGSPVLVSGLR